MVPGEPAPLRRVSGGAGAGARGQARRPREPHFFRPYNNLRFRPGPPLKEHLGVAIGYGAAGGFYFDLSLDGLLVAAGLHRPAPDQLERFRAAIADDRKARRSNAASPPPSGRSTAVEPELKRAPRATRPTTRGSTGCA